MGTFPRASGLRLESEMFRSTTRSSSSSTATPARSSDHLEPLTAASVTTVSVRNHVKSALTYAKAFSSDWVMGSVFQK